MKMMLSGANTLILDEPTNHLDIDSKEVFEEALLEFPGTVIVVSHDRYFLQRIPTRILELEHEGINEYLGKWDYYLEKKEQIQSAKKYLTEQLGGGAKGATSAEFDKAMNSAAGGQTQELSAAEQRALNKQREAEERRQARLIAKLEEEIAALEAERDEIEAQLSAEENMNDYELLAQLSARHAEVNSKLEETYEEYFTQST